MPGLLIIAHAPLASSLKAVASHAFPDCAQRLEALGLGDLQLLDPREREHQELPHHGGIFDD